MDRLVYLFELDSVRNSEQEVERGQQALYEEICGVQFLWQSYKRGRR